MPKSSRETKEWEREPGVKMEKKKENFLFPSRTRRRETSFSRFTPKSVRGRGCIFTSSLLSCLARGKKMVKGTYPEIHQATIKGESFPKYGGHVLWGGKKGEIPARDGRTSSSPLEKKGAVWRKKKGVALLLFGEFTTEYVKDILDKR